MRASCSVCRRVFQLNGNGAVRFHKAGGDPACSGSLALPTGTSPPSAAPVKLRIRLDDPETRATWEAAQRAKAEVASWPPWRRGEDGPRGELAVALPSPPMPAPRILHEHLRGTPGLARAAADELVASQPRTVIEARRIVGVGYKIAHDLVAKGLLDDPEGVLDAMAKPGGLSTVERSALRARIGQRRQPR